MSGPDTEGSAKERASIDPALYDREDVRPVLAALDISALYRILQGAGISQRQIAGLTGQSQSEVSDIVAGRRTVENHQLLQRIATGLGIPRERMGLSWWAADGTYAGEVTDAETPEGVSAEMLRRHVLALGATAAFGAAVKGLGELRDLPALVPMSIPLPSRVCAVQVAQVRDLTQLLGQLGKMHGPDPSVSSAAAASVTRLLKVPGAEPIKQALMAAVAELHIHAGWAASDAGLYRRAMIHYARALELATDAGDAYLQAHALTLAGFVTVEHGHPNDGLKMLQLAQIKAWQIPSDDPRGVTVQAWAKADSATAYAALGDPQTAHRELSTAREIWHPGRTDPTGDLDGVAALLELERGRLDLAESFAVSSVRRWEGLSRLGNTRSGVTLATIHVRAGEGDGWTSGSAATPGSWPGWRGRWPPRRCRSARAQTRVGQLAGHYPWPESPTADILELMFETSHASTLPQHQRRVPYHRAVPVSAHDIAAELRTRCPGLLTKKLHKLLYYCQAHHLAVFGEPLFTEAIEAWDMGPVVADLWAHEKYDAPPPPPQPLGERELNTVGYTLSRYGALTGKDLEVLSHGEDPWLTASQGRNPGGRAVIKCEWITAYFRGNASTGGEELGAQGEAVLSRWVRESVRPSVAPGRPLSREELVVELDRIESGLGDR